MYEADSLFVCVQRMVVFCHRKYIQQAKIIGKLDSKITHTLSLERS